MRGSLPFLVKYRTPHTNLRRICSQSPITTAMLLFVSRACLGNACAIRTRFQSRSADSRTMHAMARCVCYALSGTGVHSALRTWCAMAGTSLRTAIVRYLHRACTYQKRVQGPCPDGMLFRRRACEVRYLPMRLLCGVRYWRAYAPMGCSLRVNPLVAISVKERDGDEVCSYAPPTPCPTIVSLRCTSSLTSSEYLRYDIICTGTTGLRAHLVLPAMPRYDPTNTVCDVRCSQKLCYAPARTVSGTDFTCLCTMSGMPSTELACGCTRPYGRPRRSTCLSPPFQP
eukprot:3449845-Rhodomonas_salina.4